MENRNKSPKLANKLQELKTLFAVKPENESEINKKQHYLKMDQIMYDIKRMMEIK